ncbi:hypothetical protein GGR39_000544 [Novosphingobium fluoreni]|uniref:Glycosyltransferase subfamily 4-like N-terminal domain-containing protein n=1 Tax=Novosphingobium fluoreni TaxID=1391222 RepID=A0A7W6BYR6_9SPHN|nr:glycosyltransferase [Novosphingobium fluoreni]MBB3938915.1 hypothetical protein [Novosphingobium fluoreni]
MNILMITTTLPHRLSNGGEIATSNLIDGMNRRGHKVDVLGYTRLGDPAPEHSDFHSACDWVIETELAGPRKWLWLAQSLIHGLPYVSAKFRSREMLYAARHLCAQTNYDAVIIDHLQLGWIAKAPFLPERKIGVAHNVEHEILAVQAAARSNGWLKRLIFGRDARIMREMEREMIWSLDQIWVLTIEEQESMGALGGRRADAAIRVIPLPGQSFFATAVMPMADKDVVILGSWLWDVNRRGLEWFMREVAPLLPNDISVVIGGKGTEQVPNRTANVTYAGFVPDAAAFLRSGRAICIPTVMGAGIQLKTIEGISIGRPVVTTPLGLRGIGDVPSHVSIAVDAAQMANKLVELARLPQGSHVEAAAAWAKQRRDDFDHTIDEALTQGWRES